MFRSSTIYPTPLSVIFALPGKADCFNVYILFDWSLGIRCRKPCVKNPFATDFRTCTESSIFGLEMFFLLHIPLHARFQFPQSDLKVYSNALFSIKFGTLVYCTNTLGPIFQFFEILIFVEICRFFHFYVIENCRRVFLLFSIDVKSSSNASIPMKLGTLVHYTNISCALIPVLPNSIFLPKYHWILTLNGLVYFFKFEKKNPHFCVFLLFLHLCN